MPQRNRVRVNQAHVAAIVKAHTQTVETDRPSGFDLHAMRARLSAELLADPNRKRDLIPHRTRGHEEGCLAHEDACGRGFEAIHSGIFSVNVVAHFGFGHGLAHGAGWPGDSVAAQVNYGLDARFLLFQELL